MDSEIREHLSQIITERVVGIFKTMFDVDVKLIDEDSPSFDDDDLISKVSLNSENVQVVLRFAFPRHTLKPLLEKIYDPIMARHEATMEDAVCEISNIVCGGVKEHLNKDKYKFEMNLPTIEYGFSSYDDNDSNCLNINFILDKSNFLVDLKMENKTEKKENS